MSNLQEPLKFSNISTSCFGFFRAIPSTSPWKTRKFRALSNTPMEANLASYCLKVTFLPLI
ncbi:hypothetical protein ACHAWU_006555 [Discostella pseudostelligera]|uniref:Uncharacterized protein n=1 Tax=Discostella pseudostelligera TaxID=259834 RepID=A0ABD3MBP4_9STRA